MKKIRNKFPKTRDDVIIEAIEQCMKELYTLVQPEVKFSDFMKECEEYSKKYEEWQYMDRNKRPGIQEYCGPQPFEFYYINRDVMKEICDRYVYIYELDKQEELESVRDVLMNYFKEPIVEVFEQKEGEMHSSRSYSHPDNLKKEIEKILSDKEKTEAVYGLIENFFFMATRFFCWNRDLNKFSTSVYLGASPCTNAERVIDNWKKYRNKDIEIIPDKYVKLYCEGEDEDDYDDTEEEEELSNE